MVKAASFELQGANKSKVRFVHFAYARHTKSLVIQQNWWLAANQYWLEKHLYSFEIITRRLLLPRSTHPITTPIASNKNINTERGIWILQNKKRISTIDIFWIMKSAAKPDRTEMMIIFLFIKGPCSNGKLSVWSCKRNREMLWASGCELNSKNHCLNCIRW